jgi:hypothetical protein
MKDIEFPCMVISCDFAIKLGVDWSMYFFDVYYYTHEILALGDFPHAHKTDVKARTIEEAYVLVASRYEGGKT